jgi:hypothetical protein
VEHPAVAQQPPQTRQEAMKESGTADTGGLLVQTNGYAYGTILKVRPWGYFILKKEG